MRYQDLGKTHALTWFGMTFRLVYPVAVLLGLTFGFLVFVWGWVPSALTALAGGALIGLALGRFAEIPDPWRQWRNPFGRRVVAQWWRDRP